MAELSGAAGRNHGDASDATAGHFYFFKFFSPVIARLAANRLRTLRCHSSEFPYEKTGCIDRAAPRITPPGFSGTGERVGNVFLVERYFDA